MQKAELFGSIECEKHTQSQKNKNHNPQKIENRRRIQHGGKMDEKEKKLQALLKKAEVGARDRASEETPEVAVRYDSARDQELAKYRDFYDDVKQHGGIKENAYKSEDW